MPLVLSSKVGEASLAAVGPQNERWLSTDLRGAGGVVAQAAARVDTWADTAGPTGRSGYCPADPLYFVSAYYQQRSYLRNP